MNVSPHSNQLLTGAYHNQAHIIDVQNKVNTIIDISTVSRRGKHVGINQHYQSNSRHLVSESNATDDDNKQLS
jgi:hypothetical protein